MGTETVRSSEAADPARSDPVGAPAPAGHVAQPALATLRLEGRGPIPVAEVRRLGCTIGNRALARAVRSARVLARDLNSDYLDAVRRGDWPAAAEKLNGFNREDILRRLSALAAADVGRIHQGALDNPRVGANAQVALLTPPLLTAFGLQFRDAAELVRGSPQAMRIVAEGQAAGVRYGGFSEEGPGRTNPGAIPYTIGSTIYVPRARLGDRVLALKGFVFEINNAVRHDRFATVSQDAREGRINATQYARRNIELEVEGMLRMGAVWAEIKANMGGGRDLNTYDQWFYTSEYGAVSSGRQTAAELATDVGNRRYTAGTNAGTTVTQFYVNQFNAVYGHH